MEGGMMDVMDVMDRLMRFQGSYQLTFFNQLMLESSIIIKLFNTYGDILPGSRIYSCLRRRCYIHYSTPLEAINALKELKSCKLLHNLEIAPDCLRKERIPEKVEPEPELILPCLGTYDITFTTDRFVNTSNLKEIFAEFGSVVSVQSNLRSIRGRVRVFVKYQYESGALAALKSLKSTFSDLSVAKDCSVAGKEQKKCHPDRSGFYCVRYNELDEAEAAVEELKDGGHLLCVGLAAAGSAEGGDRKLRKKPIPNPPQESALELLVSNYPHSLPVHKLQSFLAGISSAQIREMVVSGSKAYAFVRCESMEEMKLGVRTCHNKLLGGRRVKVQAKLPMIQASIMKELDQEQSCTGIIQEEDITCPLDLCTDISEEEEDIFSGHSSPTTAEHADIRPNQPELVLANFSEETSVLDIQHLLREFTPLQVDLREPTTSEPFTYAIVSFITKSNAEKVINMFDGSNELGSENLIVEYNL
ncbi:uncharacterized protein LOC111707985 isoform X2 [Eurytemora carolleeae]|uniref:uncharacterized protein LOC111707985 isoform X2 n=1 Tax=Eurytemora carolleeae TaxID=1294199 RepID=UPI000C790551|nr:uncharacterized protein LOC111707985 isoform X2 [Eurytemora carolleeae]|eukprot:XP_023336959.1 uncharacterized protein LOC111707985 isoform X2 [Eurytemora affinis]